MIVSHFLAVKYHKKFISLLVLLLVLMFSACQSEQNTGEATNDLPNTESPKPASSALDALEYTYRESSLEGGQKVPLVLAMHGFKSNMDDLFVLSQFVDSRYMYVSLQAPHSTGPNSYKWFDLIFSNGGDVHGNKSEAIESAELVSNFIDGMVERYAVDEEKVYLLGFSQGAMLSLLLALSEPEKVAGAALLSGKIIKDLEKDVSENKEAISKLSFLVTHGKKDKAIDIEKAREMKKMLEEKSVNLSYNEYDMKHQISQDCIKDITKWFANQLD